MTGCSLRPGSGTRPEGTKWSRFRSSRRLAVAVAVAALAVAGCSNGAATETSAASAGEAVAGTPEAATPAPAVAQSDSHAVTAPPAATATVVPVAASAAQSPADAAGERWAAPADADLPAATAAKLQAALDGWAGSAGIPGLAAAVVTPDGSWAGAAGTDAAGAAIAPESVFSIASITKTFVAAEVLRLAAAGAIDLDAPVTTYVDLPFDTAGATVRQLATMRSGFPGFVPDVTLQPLVAKDLTRRWTARDIVELSAGEPRIGTLDRPGKYNGLNYVVLGLVVEKVTGEPLSAAVRRDLLAPAGLDRVWTQPDETPGKPVTVAVDASASRLDDPASGFLPSLAAASTGRGGAGMAADAPSLALWGYLLYGGRVIDPDRVATMTAGDPEADNGYGFGTMTADMGGDVLVGHAGDYMGYSSVLFVWPGTRTAVAVLAPRQGASVDGTLPGWAIGLYGMLGD